MLHMQQNFCYKTNWIFFVFFLFSWCSFKLKEGGGSRNKETSIWWHTLGQKLNFCTEIGLEWCQYPLDISILVIFDTNWIIGQKSFVCPSVWQFPLCFHHYCYSSFGFFHPIRKLNGCVSTVWHFFLYANRGFHVEICAKTRVSLHSQLHSNYVVFALLLYEKCRTVAEKKITPPEVICATNPVPICLLIGLFREIQCIFTP